MRGTYYGSCTDTPGDVSTVQAAHEHGVSTLSVAFNAYCTLGTDGGKSIVSGTALDCSSFNYDDLFFGQ